MVNKKASYKKVKVPAVVGAGSPVHKIVLQ
jgi:hypothetical protein